MIEDRSKKLWVCRFLLCIVSTPTSGAVRALVAGQDSTPQPSSAKRQLQDRLDSFNATPLKVIDVDGAPLQVSGAHITSIKIDGNYVAPVDSVKTIRLRFTVVNRADRIVSGVGLQFTNTQDNITFFLYYGKLEIEEGKSKSFEIPSMYLTGDLTGCRWWLNSI